MSKKPVYHLDECKSCVHRHVCKHIDKIDKLLRNGSIPLDLRGASCTEYIHEDVVDENWRDYLCDDDEYVSDLLADQLTEEIDPDDLIASINYALADVLSKGISVDAMYVNQNTMEIMKKHYGAEADLSLFILRNGSKVPIRIDNQLDTGFFALQLGGGS